ncbi:HD-GYP domain-containing protein [Aneurinibacillus terranovensis]|uniref:HD-GYP domain-containing protein n=1 Tax=Aneurinibacillus terranovensis TaxID=278991 RepID=UPI0004250600|nr:HD-GYP domain-containing protein [Aneurinibacillus terranovensis]
MRLIATSRCQPGMLLAKPIYTETGSVLLGKDVELTSGILKRLNQMGIDTLYIRDKATEDLLVEDVISDETRRMALRTIHDGFSEIARSEVKWRTRFSGEILQNFRDTFEAILSDLKANRKALNLLTNIYTYDNYIYSHSFNVAIYATALGIEQGLTDKELRELGLGALLHDIGKMMIPGEILYKPGKVTDEEYEVIKKHAEYGFDILRNQEGVPLLSAHCAFQHHERMDGSGYPRGLKSNEIHHFAKIMGVCDVFDALTTHRVYRKAMLPHEAMEILYGESNKHFEEKYVLGFRKTVALYPIGLTVRLSTGEFGVVVDYNRQIPARPVVRILKNPDGSDVEAFYEIDLSKSLHTMITECETLL